MDEQLTSGEYEHMVAAGENEDAAGMQGGTTGAEAGAEPSGSQGPGHGGGVASDGEVSGSCIHTIHSSVGG